MFGNFSFFTTPSLGQFSIPNSFLSLFIFYILSYLLSKTMGCLSGSCLASQAALRGVLRQHSEVVLWNLLSVQMIFW